MKRVWPSFETANTLAPEYARIAQEMVRFLPPGTPFPRTDKGTVIRAAFYNTFKSDIEEIYEDLERGAVNGGLELPETEIKDFVRNTVLSLLRLPDPLILRDDTDFFSIGMDSLMAARIRSAILKNLNTGGQTLGLNIVFEKPSVNQLSRFLFRLRVPEKSGVEEEETVEETMKRLIEKYPNSPCIFLEILISRVRMWYVLLYSLSIKKLAKIIMNRWLLGLLVPLEPILWHNSLL